MTDYSDMPQASTLYTEQQQVRLAMDYLASGGSITSMTVNQPPPPPFVIGVPMPAPVPSPAPMPMVTIALVLPNPQSLVDQAMAALQARDDEITQQLADLGVTNPPSRRELS